MSNENEEPIEAQPEPIEEALTMQEVEPAPEAEPEIENPAPVEIPDPAPEPVAPVVAAPLGIHYVCVEPFTHFGHKYHPSDKTQGEHVVDPTGWPEGTLERRIQHGFVKIKTG